LGVSAAVLGTAFLLTTLLLTAAGISPLAPLVHIFRGAFGSLYKWARVINAWVPLTLCGCGLLFTFRIGLWNIGVEGQVIMGAVTSTLMLRFGVGAAHPALWLAAAFAAGIAGGAVWALIAGFLKTHGGVNEIFAGLGLNFVAQGLVLWLIFGPWKRPGVASMSGTAPFPRELWMPVSAALRISPLGVGFAVIAVIVGIFLLHFTRMGLRLTAVGNNPRAVLLHGLRPNRYMLMAMCLAGGFAGLAGSVQVTGVYHRLIPAISSNYGYLALLVVMLAGNGVIATPMIAFFFAALNVGGIQLPMVLKLDSSLAGVIQGVLVLSALLVAGLRDRRKRIGNADG
jgi:simple sugar transport system permease protein